MLGELPYFVVKVFDNTLLFQVIRVNLYTSINIPSLLSTVYTKVRCLRGAGSSRSFTLRRGSLGRGYSSNELLIPLPYTEIVERE